MAQVVINFISAHTTLLNVSDQNSWWIEYVWKQGTTYTQRQIIDEILGEPRLSQAEYIIDSAHHLPQRQKFGNTPETSTGRKQQYYTAGRKVSEWAPRWAP